MEPTVWLAYFAASWAISLSPGAAAVLAMSVGLNHGLAKGWVTPVGLVLGVWTQLAIVAGGLGALVATSATAFAVVKWSGVAYLLWLGWQQWRAPAHALSAPAEATPTATAWTLLRRGWLVNALNPKGTVFLLAVLPQFMDLSRPLGMQYLLMGLTLGLTEGVVMSGYAALAARVLRSLQSPRHMRWLNRLFGGLFLLAGTGLALFHRS